MYNYPTYPIKLCTHTAPRLLSQKGIRSKSMYTVNLECNKHLYNIWYNSSGVLMSFSGSLISGWGK